MTYLGYIRIDLEFVGFSIETDIWNVLDWFGILKRSRIFLLGICTFRATSF